MKHVDFTSKPIRLINPNILKKRKSIYDKPPHERILFTKRVTFPKEWRDSPTKRRLQK